MKTFFSILTSLFLCVVFASPALGQVPKLINFQAQLDDFTGNTASVTFEIFNAASGGTALWSETHASVAIPAGRLQVLLGSVTPIPESLIDTEGNRFLQITINGEALSPRSQLTSVSYALRALVADRVLNGGTGTSGITEINAGAGIAVSDNDGPVTEISLDANTITDEYIADNSLTALSLANNSVGNAELQEAITLGPGGSLEVANNAGQVASIVSTNGEDGVISIKEYPLDYNAIELSTRPNGLGGEFVLRGGNQFSAIQMFADSDTDGGRIVMREPTGQSMVLTATDGDGRLVLLKDGQVVIALNAHKENILATGKVGIGVSGDLNNIDLTHALEVTGDVRITGNLMKGSGSFTIDHPLDPLNKTLSHSFVESPDMMNVYNGNVTLDENGEAWVHFPEWFDSLNRSFRYQLTCIGGFAPVYVSEEISDNRFKIAGGTQGLKVSWQVTGIRKDPYAEHKRIQVEEDKPANEKGKYLHPDAYGQTKSNN